MRSQDKKSLRIVSNINIIHEDDKFFICNYTGIANIKLGKYEYEKRALEILNEIQNILKPKIIYNQSNPIETMSDAIYQIKQDVDMKIQELSTYVYEMPIE